MIAEIVLLLALLADSSPTDSTVESAQFGGMSLARAIELSARDRPQPQRKDHLLIISRRDHHRTAPPHFSWVFFLPLPRFLNIIKQRKPSTKREGKMIHASEGINEQAERVNSYEKII